jgi:spore coat protein H
MRALSLILPLSVSLSALAVGSGCDDEQLLDAKNGGNRVFDTSVLHKIEIEVDEQHLAGLDEDTDTRVPCTFTFDGETIEGAGCKKKGQTTLRPLAEKPSLSVKLDVTDSTADVDGIEKIILNNTIMDPTFLSEPMTYALYDRAGIPAPRTSHAVVTFNGTVKGIYVVVEGVDKDFLRDHFEDGEGNLYEGPWDFPMGADAADLKDEDEGRTRDDLAAFTAAVLDADDASLEQSIEEHIDVDAFLTSVAVDMSVLAWDGYAITAWNWYLYRDPSTNKFVMLPHGADWPYWHDDVDPFFPGFQPWGEEYPPGFLAERAVAAPGLADRYRARLREVRDDAFDVDTMIEQIDGIARVIRDADTNVGVLRAEVDAFDAHVEEGRQFVRNRRAYLDGLSL